MQAYVLPLGELSLKDVSEVGGKNASLGEMLQHLQKLGLHVPDGIATTASAYRLFLKENNLDDFIQNLLSTLNPDDTQQLTKVGLAIREKMLNASLPQPVVTAIAEAYQQWEKNITSEFSVAVRSSATAEDLPNASFAGQQETYLNVSGLENIIETIKKVFASLFTDRAINYRAHQKFDHHRLALSVGIQRMVRSDLAASGVMFTLDTESGFDKVILINATYGLGELVVQGIVSPDEFYVHKENIQQNKPAILRRTLGDKKQKMIYSDTGTIIEPVAAEAQHLFSITDDDIQALAKQALLIEKHYGRAMDIEWAKDGIDGKIYIVQARPETVRQHDNQRVLTRYQLTEKSNVIAMGRSVGHRIGQGIARVLKSSQDLHRVQPGDVLVTDITDPDWEPVMKRSAAIVTNRGGRTCHAAIIARELDIPAVVGCGDATTTIRDGDWITVSCAEGDTGYIYEGQLTIHQETITLDSMPTIPTKLMMNIANPERAFSLQKLPNAGIGLARLEFIINNTIGFHPQALLAPDQLPKDLQQQIHNATIAYGDPKTFYIEKLVEGISTLAAAFFPHPVIVRLSDFKSNEYANLIGGKYFEPTEENPMIGFRGTSRYLAEHFQPCFALECVALRKVREEMGFHNIQVMVPFVRTLLEADKVTQLLAQLGLKRGDNGLKILMMCEIPSNALLAEAFLQYFDGFSIGSNDLTQLTLGLDRDSGIVAKQFDERDPAVKILLNMAITACLKNNKYIGICGQGPSDYPDFAEWLVEQGIQTLSLNPDSILATWLHLAK